MIILALVLFAGLIIYFFTISEFTYSWKNLPEYSLYPFEGKLPSISVVIPFRNEISNILTLLNCLKDQTYSNNNYEVILIDDHSSDGSEIIVKNFCKKKKNFFYLTNDKIGKKTALNLGIMMSQKELIVTTDADCIIKNFWLEIIANFYLKYKPDIITGLVDIKTEKGFFNRFQEIDFLSLVASGAGSCALGKPIYCNAANLAFKKEFYKSIDDPLFNKAESGDDTFFLHKAKKNKKNVMLLKSKDTIVTTYGLNSFQDYINQRIRWISKSKYYRDKDAIYTSIVVLLMNLICITAFVLLISGTNLWLFPVIMSLKIFTDYSLVKSFVKFYGRKTGLGLFVIMSIIYPFNILLIIYFAMFKKIKWKGR